MTVRAALAAGFLLAALAMPRVAGADVIELMNGVRVVGKVVETTGGQIAIKVGENTVRIPQNRVRSITFDDGQSGAAPAPKPEVVVSTTPERQQIPISPPIATALTALDRLQAATARSLPPAEYSARVDEVRRVVEESLAQSPERDDVRAAMMTALRYHEFAASAGATYDERRDLASIGREPLVAECRALRDLIAQDAGRLRLNPDDPAVIGLFVAAEGAPSLRSCAADKIAEAEGLARMAR